MVFFIKLADKIIEVNAVYDELKTFFSDYLIDEGMPDFTISWTEEEILAEKDFLSEIDFPNTYLETLTALRKISEIFPFHERLLIHGASIAYHDKGYLFTAPSGTGKSTHICLWKKFLGKEVKIVNGDKPFVSLENNAPYIHGTPWAGKENWQKNRSVPLNGICFLKRGLENRIQRLEPSQALTHIFQQVYLPKNPEAAALTLELTDRLLRHTPLYLLECNMSEEAVRCSFEALTGLNYK